MPVWKRFLLLPALCSLLLIVPPGGTAQAANVNESRAIFQELDQIVAELSRISGLKLHKKIAYDLISREKVKEFLQKRVKEVSTPEELRAEELTLKMFGLVPPDFDLAKTTVDLLTEQAAAFYDYKTRKLYISDWTSSTIREAALAHELAHALADQNFNLDKFIKRGQDDDDSSMARMAVMEGQASWLMAEYLAQKTGRSLLTSPGLLSMMSSASDMDDGSFPVFGHAPLYIRDTLIFPYTKGMLFQNAVIRKMGKAGFTEVFRHPPISTQQILHPIDYFSKEKPASPALPTPPSLHGFKRLVQGSIGELDHSILLRQFAGKKEAGRLAPHWRGGRYLLYENQKTERVILCYASEWDAPEAARKYFQVYQEILRKKWKNMTVSSESETSISGTSDDGDFTVRLNGNIVTSVEGGDETRLSRTASRSLVN